MTIAAHVARDEPVLSFPLVATKLTPPFARHGLIERARLLDQLSSDTMPPLVSVAATAGYGKSTLLHQWLDRCRRPSTWLTLDAHDNDPVVLLTYLAVALDRVTPIDPELFRLLAVEHPSIMSITRALGDALSAWPRPGALVLDDVHMLQNPDCHDIVARLVEYVPAGSHVALASRVELPIPIPQLRARGQVMEIGPVELALDYAEATALLEGAGVKLSATAVHDLVDVAEGWPAAIYLAGRSVKARGRGADLDLSWVGQSREFVAYAHAELLSALPDRTVQFLTRSSVLDRMSGPLCDAVLRTSGSADRLERMVGSNLLVTPLDDHRGWYRYHHLFRELLRGELEHREPALVPELTRRAGRWCEDNGLQDAAIEYAIAAGDTDRAARIVQMRALALYRAGRIVTLRRWYDWLDRGGHMSRYPATAVSGAWIAALTGRASAAERWADAAEHGRREHGAAGPGAASLDGHLALLRIMLYRDGVDAALVDADIAEGSIPLDDTWRAATLTAVGIAHLLSGFRDEADRAFVRAVDVGRETGALPALSVALAQRALVALDRGDHDHARSLSDEACAVVGDGRLQDHVTNVLVYAVAARMAMRAGDPARAGQLLTQAQRLRPRLTYGLPHIAVQSRVNLIRTLLSLADGPGARTVLREVDDILRLRPKLGVLATQVEELRVQIARTPVGEIGASSLTAAELRLLPFLQTHLTFRQIGERLYVSHHTIKTQAISIYRKLGVSSRNDAMRLASEAGLLPQ